MFHLHRWRLVRRAARVNRYEQCRSCPQRRIVQPDRGIPMDHRWLDGGDFAVMPARGPGPSGVSGQARAAR